MHDDDELLPSWNSNERNEKQKFYKSRASETGFTLNVVIWEFTRKVDGERLHWDTFENIVRFIDCRVRWNDPIWTKSNVNWIEKFRNHFIRCSSSIATSLQRLNLLYINQFSTDQLHIGSNYEFKKKTFSSNHIIIKFEYFSTHAPMVDSYWEESTEWTGIYFDWLAPLSTSIYLFNCRYQN